MRLEAAEAALKEMRARAPATEGIKHLTEPFAPPHPEDSDFIDLADTFRTLSVERKLTDPGFQGKSSMAALVKVAVAKKPRVEGSRTMMYSRNPTASKPWALRPVISDIHTQSRFLPTISLQWEDNPTMRHHTFPDDELMVTLVSLYFSNVNVFIPLLHRPTFLEAINERLYLRDSSCASTLLSVCAVGSLYLTDPGVSLQDREALGWRCYNQVEFCGHPLRRQPALPDLQIYCVRIQNLSSDPKADFPTRW